MQHEWRKVSGPSRPHDSPHVPSARAHVPTPMLHGTCPLERATPAPRAIPRSGLSPSFSLLRASTHSDQPRGPHSALESVCTRGYSRRLELWVQRVPVTHLGG